MWQLDVFWNVVGSQCYITGIKHTVVTTLARRPTHPLPHQTPLSFHRHYVWNGSNHCTRGTCLNLRPIWFARPLSALSCSSHWWLERSSQVKMQLFYLILFAIGTVKISSAPAESTSSKWSILYHKLWIVIITNLFSTFVRALQKSNICRQSPMLWLPLWSKCTETKGRRRLDRNWKRRLPEMFLKEQWWSWFSEQIRMHKGKVLYQKRSKWT